MADFQQHQRDLLVGMHRANGMSQEQAEEIADKVIAFMVNYLDSQTEQKPGEQETPPCTHMHCNRAHPHRCCVSVQQSTRNNPTHNNE